jgi:hypothetical protein
MEMAVLSMVQHPNIVQLYSYLTDMVEVSRGEMPPPRGTLVIGLPRHGTL